MKRLLTALLALTMVISLAACGDSKPGAAGSSAATSVSSVPFVISEDPVVVDGGESSSDTADEKEEVIPPNSYRSELTNEWISNDIKNQRPVAVMIDNENLALPHYGTSDADIVYEMVNSTANDRITRLMCIFKDWENVEQIGNIRSTRPTNAMIFAEYNAVLVHDGGPYLINEWLEHPNSKQHLSSGFARIDRGKQSFYEEYATNTHYSGVGEFAGNSYKSLRERIVDAGFGTEYNDDFMGNHFLFSDKKISLKDEKDAITANTVKPNFPHNASTLEYDSKKGVYVYSEYGEKYEDALYSDGRGLEFKNIIVYATPLLEYGEGYMAYMAIGTTQYGYYMTDGYAVPIWWEKKSQDDLTKFYRISDNSEIVLNTGKTYIALCPLDTFESSFVIK